MRSYWIGGWKINYKDNLAVEYSCEFDVKGRGVDHSATGRVRGGRIGNY